jgi:hypothetical protein
MSLTLSFTYEVGLTSANTEEGKSESFLDSTPGEVNLFDSSSELTS